MLLSVLLPLAKAAVQIEPHDPPDGLPLPLLVQRVLQPLLLVLELPGVIGVAPQELSL